MRSEIMPPLEMKLQLEPREICGSQRFYVLDNTQAFMMEKLAKCKTLTRDQINALKYFGFELELVHPVIEL